MHSSVNNNNSLFQLFTNNNRKKYSDSNIKTKKKDKILNKNKHLKTILFFIKIWFLSSVELITYIIILNFYFLKIAYNGLTYN